MIWPPVWLCHNSHSKQIFGTSIQLALDDATGSFAVLHTLTLQDSQKLYFTLFKRANLKFGKKLELGAKETTNDMARQQCMHIFLGLS